MRVMQVNAVVGIGSTGRSVVEMDHLLKELGHESYIVSGSPSNYDHVYQVGSAYSHKLHALLARLTGFEYGFSFFSTLKLTKYIGYIKPDVVFLRNIHANFVNLPILLQFLAENDIPTILVLHDCWFFTAKCTHYSKVGCVRWKTGCHDCPRLKNDIPSWFFDRTRYLWSKKKTLYEKIPRLGVIGVSEWIASEARLSILSCTGQIRRVYNWIDLDQFKPGNSISIRNELGLNGCFIILGVASGWTKAKGLDAFIELESLLGDDERIVLIGKMPTGICLPRKIISIPATENVDILVNYYSAADVFIQMSQEESFGKVVAEALACGIPVITNSRTANPELVTPETGIVVNNMSPASVYHACKRIKEKGKEAYAESCRKFAVDNFDMRHSVLQYIDMTKSVIGKE